MSASNPIDHWFASDPEMREAAHLLMGTAAKPPVVEEIIDELLAATDGRLMLRYEEWVIVRELMIALAARLASTTPPDGGS